uniref:Uncharacterized protein n=1 Tax=Microchaete diplosiphon TaxID=1197 RepID=Q6H097_MICDP|nr:hypothetical protein [Fremyella diplosiphon Fd33]
MGVLIVSKGFVWGAVALKTLPSAKLILLAVLATNEPPTFRVAFAPKKMPLGLIKNKLALEPAVASLPKISERLLPVTRTKIFCRLALGLKKTAERPSLMLNSKKL